MTADPKPYMGCTPYQAYERGLWAAPEGYALVPLKVTNNMIDAANDTPCGFAGSPPHWQFVWDAMIAAAPTHEETTK